MTTAFSALDVKTDREPRKEIDEKVHQLELNHYDTHTHGDMLNVVTNDADMPNNTISQNLTQIAIGYHGGRHILRTNLRLTLVAVVAVPLSLLASKGVMPTRHRYFREQQVTVGKLNGYIEELYAGQSMVQAFNYQKRPQRRFSELNGELRDCAEKDETFLALSCP